MGKSLDEMERSFRGVLGVFYPLHVLLTKKSTGISSTERSKLGHNTHIPSLEAYITAVEEASSKLPSREADELKSDVSHLLGQHNRQQNNHSSLHPIQYRALTQLKQDTSRVVLTADKVTMVILDQQDYINKANALLQDTNTYKVLIKDPTNSLKNKPITLLKDIKHQNIKTHSWHPPQAQSVQ